MTTTTQTEAQTAQNHKLVTFRNGGKAHRGIMFGGFLMACCSCPGSQNGRLTNGATIICEGHDKANCGK